MKKRILVIGNGGREHAICWSIAGEKAGHEIFCAQGNAGIAQVASCVDIAPTNIEGLLKFAQENKIGLTIVGGENSLALGIVDEFEKSGQRILGPTLAAARLEYSKAFAKDFMIRHKIPTAEFGVAESLEQALILLKSGKFGDEKTPVVVKADGLAGGKGVILTANHEEAVLAIKELINNTSVDKKATNKIVLEQTLKGVEVSLLLFTDGENFALMPPARDYKRIGENNIGANTGGMGTICDDDLISDCQRMEIIDKIIEPTLRGATKEGFAFRGILFLGLILTSDGAKVIEYNVRFGDPEAQSILIRLDNSLLEICESIIDRKLDRTTIKFDEQKSCCVILAARNYPENPELGNIIRGLETDSENITIFHSGTRQSNNGEIITNGGRVLGVTAKSHKLKTALKVAYSAIKEIKWEGMQYRRDIGQ